MPINRPVYDLPLFAGDTRATKATHNAEVNRVLGVLADNDEALSSKIDGSVAAGVLVGDWDAGSGAFPTTRPNGDPIKRGDIWRVTGSGTVDDQDFDVGDYLQAVQDGGGVTFAGNWVRAAIGLITAAADRAEAAAAALEGVAFASAVTIELVAGQTDYPLAYDPGLDEMLVDFNGLTLKFAADYSVVYILAEPHIRLVETPVYSHSAGFPQLLTYRSAAAVPYDPNLNRGEFFPSFAALVTHIAGNGAVQGQQYTIPGAHLWAPTVGHVDYGFSLPGLIGVAPAGGILDISMTGSPSDLANDFAGRAVQAMHDAHTRKWLMRFSRGDWETQPIVFDAAADGLLHIDFAPGATLIGPAKWQHFAGDGTTKNFVLTAWGTASTDTCVAAIVYADGSYTVLTSGDGVNGFVKTGTGIALGSAVAAPPIGATLTTAATSALMAIRGEGRSFGLRLRGGDFYNGDMGYVEQQGSGSAVVLQTLRDVYWDGAPIFRGHPDHTFNAHILDRRGDSGLVVLNVERASFYGAQFLYQPDLGNYTSGLARGIPPEDYHIDDGRFVNFFGAQAYMCGTAFRSARDGGGYGMYGCGADLCSDGFLAADVSSGGLPSGRNIVIDGFTCRKIARNVLDLREMRSANVRNLMIEDWGRLPDGTVPATPFPMFNLGSGADYMRIDARLRYEEWEPPSAASTFVVMANASFRDTKINLSIDLPESAIGAGHTAVLATGAIGSTGLIDLDLNLTNVDNDLNVPTNKVVRAKVAHVTRTTGGTTISRYRQHKGIVTPENTGNPGESIGLAVPNFVFQTMNDTVITADTVNTTGRYVRQGNVVMVSGSCRANVVWGTTPASGFFRMRLDPNLPNIGSILAQKISFWQPSLPDAHDIGVTDAGEFVMVPASNSNNVDFYAQGENASNETTRTALNTGHLVTEGTTFIRIDFAVQYLISDAMP